MKFSLQLHILSSLLFISSVNADLLDSVLFVGDSDVYYWAQQGDSNNFIPGSVNVGVSGWTCADVNGKINDWLDQYEPTLIVLKCGTNDMWGVNQVSPEEAVNRFTKVIDKIAATETPVIAMSTKPEIPVLNAGAPAERWKKFNSLVKDYAVSQENTMLQGNLPLLSFIDSFEGLLAVGNSPTLYASDKIHLSASGYEYWNTWVDTVIEELMSANGSDCAVWLSDECELFLDLTDDNTFPSFAPSVYSGNICSQISDKSTCNKTQGCGYNVYDSSCKEALTSNECAAFNGRMKKCNKHGCKWTKSTKKCKGRWN